MNRSVVLAVIVVCLAVLDITGLTFTQDPVMSFNSGSGTWAITFEVSEATDVEVAVVNSADSTIVRRLAAGKLGDNPPAPFAANSLSQSLEWDGKDDAGQPVDGLGDYTVRVRAGMSTRLEQTVDPNPYFFSGLYDAALGENNTVYVYGTYSSMPFGLMKTVREFDGNGNYVRTIFPYPAGLGNSTAMRWGAHLRNDNTYCPAFADPASPSLGGMIGEGASMMPGTSGGALFFHKMVSYYPNPLQWEIQAVSLSDFMVSKDTLVTSTTELPTIAYVGNGGPQLFTAAAQAGVFFLSGVFNAADNQLNRTGFWRDGTIYKINSITGLAEKWLEVIPIDSIPEINSAARQSSIGPKQNYDSKDWCSCAAIHGIAFDDSGRVFVCNRLKQTIDVFDTASKALVGSFASPFPHMVEVNRKTNEIYVLSRSIQLAGAQIAALRKYSSWRTPAVTASLLNIDPDMNYHTTLIRMLVNQGGDNPVIWLTHKTVQIVRDDGDRFTVLKDFDDLCKEEKTNRSVQWNATVKPTLFERMAVDRRTETLYFTNGWSGFYRISDWTNGSASLCSTSTKKTFFAREAAISPDGYLWVSDGESLYDGPVARYTLDAYPAPAPLARRGSNQFDSVYSRYGHALGDKGIAVSRFNQVAVCDAVNITTGAYELKVWNADDTSRAPYLKATPWSLGGGVKFDYDGNIYASGLVHAPGYVMPSGFTGDRSYITTVGSVVKFPAGATGISMAAGSAAGASRIYKEDHAPFSGGGGGCNCRSPRFDLDPYGRLFIPNGLASCVAVVDNNDNPILSLGQYGNVDSRGAGSLVPGPAIPLGTPTTVAASDDYLYIGDILNARLVRVKLDYALNSMPSIHTVIAGSAGLMPQAAPAMAAAPNPFNSMSRIAVTLPQAGQVRLAVYDVNGRCVKTLAQGNRSSGSYVFNWDATDKMGATVSAGVYIYKMTAGSRVLTCRILLAK